MNDSHWRITLFLCLTFSDVSYQYLKKPFFPCLHVTCCCSHNYICKTSYIQQYSVIMREIAGRKCLMRQLEHLPFLCEVRKIIWCPLNFWHITLVHSMTWGCHSASEGSIILVHWQQGDTRLCPLSFSLRYETWFLFLKLKGRKEIGHYPSVLHSAWKETKNHMYCVAHLIIFLKGEKQTY